MSITVNNRTSRLTVNNVTRTVTIAAGGRQGALGLNFRDEWTPGETYAPRDVVYHGGSSWRALTSHVASALNQPGGEGAGSLAAWTLLAQGADPDTILEWLLPVLKAYFDGLYEPLGDPFSAIDFSKPTNSQLIPLVF